MKSGNLDQGQEARDDQGGRHEILLRGRGEVGRSREDDGRRDDARQHGQGMLKAQQQGEEYGQLVVESKKGGSLSLPSHKGDVGRE